MEEAKYDTIYRRLFAKIIDYILIGIIVKIFAFIFIPQTTYSINLGAQNGEIPILENPNLKLNFWIENGELLTSLFMILYFIALHFLFGQTIGKMITGVKVWNNNESQKISILQATLRNTPDLVYAITIYFISFEYLPIIIISTWNISNFIQVFGNKKHKTLNDLIARTVVLKIKQEKLIINHDVE